MQSYEKYLPNSKNGSEFEEIGSLFGIFLLYFFLIWQKCCYFAPNLNNSVKTFCCNESI